MAIDFKPAAPKINFQPTPADPVVDTSDGIKLDAAAPEPKPQFDFKPAQGATPKIDFQPVAKAAPVDFKPADDTKKFSWSKLGEAALGDAKDIGNAIVDPIKNPARVLAGEIKPGTEAGARAGFDTAAIMAGGDAFAAKAAPKVAAVVAEDAPKTMLDKAKDVGAAVRNIFSPTSAGPDAKKAEQAIRSNFGDATRESAKTDTTLANYEARANDMKPEEQAAFYNYVENRSKPEQAAPALSPEMKDFAGSLQAEFLKRREALEALDKTQSMGFVQDYFPHMWKDEAKAKAFTGDWISKFGSGKSTNARSIPTIEDGLKAGLQLAEPNPARAASRYVNSMDRYIATVKLIEDARKNGDALWSNAYKPPREGWVPLDGPMAKKPAKEFPSESGESARVGEQRLFAPPDFARVYNNFASKGLEGTVGAPIYEAARQLKNTWTAATLSLSGYHFGTILAEQLGTDMGRLMKNISVGDLKGAGQAAKNLATIPLVMKGRGYQTGKRLADQYTGRFDHGMDTEAMADHFAKSGGSFKIDPVYQAARNKDDFMTAYQKGTLGQDMKDLAQQAKAGPLGSVKATADLAARAADTISAPLFKRYIPTIKAGAFSDLMGDWLRQHPNADETEVAAARTHYQDLVEERFGEMNPDNLFWNQTLKQTMGLLLTARTWDLGLVRQVGGPFADAAKFIKGGLKDSKLTDRGFGLAGLLTASLGANAAYQYLKTGQLPQTKEDWIAPRTGGQIEGQPERVDLPGRLREVKQLLPRAGGFEFGPNGQIKKDADGQPLIDTDPLSGVKSEGYNKLSAPVQGAINYFSGKNPYPNDLPGVPISVQGLMQGKQQGSKVGGLETVMGIRGAPFRETNPQAASDIAKKKSVKAERQRLFLDALHKKQYPDDVRN